MRRLPSLSSRRVLVDTSAYYALATATDQYHQRAQALLTGLAQQRWRLFTTTYLVAETHALLLARLGRDAAVGFLRAQERGSTTIVQVSAADEAAARSIIYRYEDKEFSLTDATSFVVMERLGISIAFAFDRDFVQYGLTLLSPDHLSPHP